MAERRDAGLQALLIGASAVIVIAGLKAASSILVPVLASALVAVLCLPPMHWLQRRKLPDWAAVLVVFLGLLIVMGGLSYLVGSSIADFQNDLPRYRDDLAERYRDQLATLTGWSADRGMEVSFDAVLGQFDPGKALQVVGNAAGALADLLSNTFFVLLTVVFILSEAAGFPQKMREAFGARRGDSEYAHIVDSVRSYLRIKTELSLLTGVLAALITGFLGVEYWVLWGVAAFILNFVPTIGSIIAAVPAVLMAFVQFGWQRALVVAIGYFVVNTVIGNVIEPKLLGRKLGLSGLVVWLSLVFWGWVWGPIGMLLSVPLTMLVKILLEYSPDLRWVSVLLGPGGEEISVPAAEIVNTEESPASNGVPLEAEDAPTETG